MDPLIVVPTLNEAATVSNVIDGALAAVPEATVLVVDDASTDGTAELVTTRSTLDERVAVLHRPAKAGLGSAYRDGFAWGLQRGFDVFCEMDADGSHHPADLTRLLFTLAGADLAIGSRYVPGGGVVDWPAHRLALSRGGNRYVQLLTGLPVADATSGFRAYRRAVLEEIPVGSLHSEGYAFQVEGALRAWRAGFRVMEVPITFTERTEGSSKISRAIVFEALWRVLVWGLTGSRHALPTHPRSVTARAGAAATSPSPATSRSSPRA